MNVKELGFQETALGDLTLRYRTEPLLGGRVVYEVKLGDEYLMSSLFTESERQLAILGLAPLDGHLDVVVGGLGLGYTAAETLRNQNVRRLIVIDLFQAVIDWHKAGLVPNAERLTGDPRCELRQGDFFDLARTSFDRFDVERKFDAVLLDIDHSPQHFLDRSNESLYTAEGLTSIANQLKTRGVFALWSNVPVDDEFTAHLESVFGKASGHIIEFPNPYSNETSMNSVYVARKAG